MLHFTLNSHKIIWRRTDREREIKEKGGIRREMNENKENKTTENNKSQSKTKAPKQLK